MLVDRLHQAEFMSSDGCCLSINIYFYCLTMYDKNCDDVDDDDYNDDDDGNDDDDDDNNDDGNLMMMRLGM